jgi:hypothetical protein
MSILTVCLIPKDYVLLAKVAILTFSFKSIFLQMICIECMLLKNIREITVGDYTPANHLDISYDFLYFSNIKIHLQASF